MSKLLDSELPFGACADSPLRNEGPLVHLTQGSISSDAFHTFPTFPTATTSAQHTGTTTTTSPQTNDGFDFPKQASRRSIHVAEAGESSTSDESPKLAPQTQHQQHGRTRRYLCDECPAGYDHRKNLRDHMQTKHKGIRYLCDVKGCYKSVAQKKNLARHKAAKHRQCSMEDTISRLQPAAHMNCEG